MAAKKKKGKQTPYAYFALRWGCLTLPSSARGSMLILPLVPAAVQLEILSSAAFSLMTFRFVNHLSWVRISEHRTKQQPGWL